MPVSFDGDVPDTGTTVRVFDTFETLGDPPLPVDPASVVLKVKDPHGIEFEQPTIRDSQGEFYGEVRVELPGQWWWRFETANPTRVSEGSFVVRLSSYSAYEPPDSAALTWGELRTLSWSGLDNLTWGDLYD